MGMKDELFEVYFEALEETDSIEEAKEFVYEGIMEIIEGYGYMNEDECIEYAVDNMEPMKDESRL